MPEDNISISEQLGAILKRWQERLIDVSKSNPLLGLNRSRAAKLEVESTDINRVVEILLSSCNVLKLPFVQKKTKKSLQLDDDQTINAGDEYILLGGDINFIYHNLGDLRRKTRKIFDNSRLTLTERGVNTLYLAMGCLEWSDSMMGKSESPLIMIPCEFDYKGASKALGLTMADEDVILNPAIRYYLKEREEIDLPEIPEDFDFEKLDSFLHSIERQVEVNGWRVTKRAWLGIFSFESLAIYQDLKMLDAQARNSTLVQAIAHLGGEAIESINLDDELDAMQIPEQIPIPVVQADSSQLRAVTLAAQGANIVIHGPPGTGKSQTITGIIANALAQNKKVLFVSSKMAALNVVHSRLQTIGLGQYCLEAHGVKSGKKKVIDELKRSLESNDEIRVAKNFNEDLARMIESRKCLNDYVKALHDSKNELSISIFNAYGIFETLNEIPLTKAPLPWSNVLQVALRDLDQVEDLLREVRDNAVLFNKRDEHLIRGMKSGGIDLSTHELLEQHLQRFISFCDAVTNETKKLSNLFKTIDLSTADLFSSVEIFEALSTVDALPTDWDKKSIEELNDKLNEIIECENIFQKKEECLKKFESFSSRTPQDVLDVVEKHLEKYPNWYSCINMRYPEAKKECRAVLNKATKLNSSLLNEVRDCSKEVISLEAVFLAKLGNCSLQDLETTDDVFEKLEYLQKKYETAISFKKWLELMKVSLTEHPIFTVETSNNFSALADVLRSSKRDIGETQQQLMAYWPNGLLARIRIDVDLLSIVESSTRLVLSGFNQSEVRDWQTISRIIDRCENNALLPFVEKLDKEQLLNAPEIFRKRFYSLWIDAMLHSNPILNEFSGSSQTDLIHKYKLLDERIMRLNLLNTIAVPAQNAREVKGAHTGVGDTNGVGILRKEMEKKKRLKPLRVLFNEIPQVLQALKPCFLMSPLSVSTFLKPGAFNFDLVIFDEASQLPTPEAIPSILRARQIVVAGDSNQLPPSSFFRTNISDDSNEWEEGQIEELESLLDDCKASVPFFQETHLKWHYRSRDERLINFSNHYYYSDNPLITFPSPSTDLEKSGVILEYVPEGVWDRGGSRINRKEARRVAELIVKQLKAEPEKTLGVVAFNSSQKEAIEDALEEELQSHRELSALIDPEKTEAFFIKSLENVQGDERDVVIISVGYGKAQDGKMSLNFGPLNTAGGWRRLNVLVTRAKWKTILVTSVRSSELIGINPENKGPIGLKNYIQYAETGYLNEGKEVAKLLAEETNDFEDSVRRELEMRGFKVDSQVGVGSFRIDLAVRDTKDPTGYAIGIECDGATYHSSRSARDRDILRQEILQGMGWKIHRVWSTEWFKKREMVVSILVENVSRAISGQAITKRKIDSVDVDFENDTSLKTITPQSSCCEVAYMKSKIKCRKDVIMDSKKIREFSNIVANIVEDEGPIHTDLVLERVKELAGIARAGSNIQSNFEAAIRLAVSNGAIEKIKEDKEFLHKVGKKNSTFRTPAGGVERRLDQISKLEIGNAVTFLIKDQFGLAYDNVVQSIKHLFRIGRTDPREGDRVKDLIDEMIAAGLIVRHGPLLHTVVT